MNIWCENSRVTDILSGRRRNDAESRHTIPPGAPCERRCHARPAGSTHRRLRIFWRALPGPVVFCSSSSARLRWVAASVPPSRREPAEGLPPH